MQNSAKASANNVVVVFRNRLRTKMESQNISCCALAKLADIPEKTLRNIIQGVAADPRLSTIAPIIAAIQCDANWMFGFPAQAENVGCDAAAYEDICKQLQRRDAELDKLHHSLVEKSAALSGKSECCESYQREAVRLAAELKAHKRYTHKLRIAIVIISALLVVALITIIYVLWDALHPGSGFFRA